MVTVKKQLPRLDVRKLKYLKLWYSELDEQNVVKFLELEADDWWDYCERVALSGMSDKEVQVKNHFEPLKIANC